MFLPFLCYEADRVCFAVDLETDAVIEVDARAAVRLAIVPETFGVKDSLGLS